MLSRSASGGKKLGKLAETKNWYSDRYQYVAVQRNILAVISLLSLGGVLGSIAIIGYLTPLKSVEPFVIQVEEKTGITQVVNPLTASEISANEALKSYFVLNYIKARENYDIEYLQRNYELVRLMSSPEEWGTFFMSMQANNPESPINKYGRHTIRTIKVKSISYLDPNTAQVRLLITEDGKNRGTKQLHMISLIRFEFANLELTIEERYTNPLGFRVISYRIDEEIINR